MVSSQEHTARNSPKHPASALAALDFHLRGIVELVGDRRSDGDRKLDWRDVAAADHATPVCPGFESARMVYHACEVKISVEETMRDEEGLDRKMASCLAQVVWMMQDT